MQEPTASWEDLRVLLAVSRATSFLAAGRTLGVATSTVARRVSGTTCGDRAAPGSRATTSAATTS